ncbi:response regulator transcription factor [Autumnicola edwardsiae]|uniref:Response regulator transcription factor n=1 Tax=Autumnicola edwardsiae TaxID=3075594 RepID=A0ABU3CSM0_9FLAO|nr:response regulator transcription factor [Zunongwangia sp. F297]MDT0649356.1 response regulator transcription factor [Zunongwangia sp. F297]
MKILIVEDEQEMLENMKQGLQQEKFLVETAADYHSALNKIGVYNYDCILLDITLPDENGLELLKYLKEKQLSDNVIIVSAKDSLDDKLTGLNLGADDYLPKPFHMAELTARVKAVLRRNNFDGNNFVQIANVKLDLENRDVFIQDKPVEFNRKEFDILSYFFSNKNRLVTKTALAERVWGDHIDQVDNFEFVYSQIKNLRKKLKQYKSEVEIKSVYGIGYRLSEK